MTGRFAAFWRQPDPALRPLLDLAILVTLIVRPSGFFGKQKELEERV
jgi:hypothetical protein